MLHCSRERCKRVTNIIPVQYLHPRTSYRDGIDSHQQDVEAQVWEERKQRHNGFVFVM